MPTRRIEAPSFAASPGAGHGRPFQLLLSQLSWLLLLAGLCLGQSACSYEQTLIVIDVLDVPASTQSLVVQATLDGKMASEPMVFTQELSRFGIRIAKDRRGLLAVSLMARDVSGCVLARGSAEISVDGGMEYALTIALMALPSPSCELRVSKTGPGGGVVQVPGGIIDCGAQCSGYFVRGESITLTAQADASSHFLGWSGPCSGTSTCTLGVAVATEVKALFVKRQTSLCPQPGWCWENPNQHGSTQLKIWGSSSRDLWSVGAVGTILHWDGQSWFATPAGSSQSINRIFGVPGGDVWAVGGSGTILRFRDGAWTAVSSGVQNNLSAIFGVTADDLWAVGANYILLHWNGSAWSPVTPSGMPAMKSSLNAIWGSQANDLWAVGGGGTAFHYDGKTWTLQSPIGALNLQGLAGSSGSDIWAVSSDGVIVRYNGTSWQNQTPTYPQPLNDVAVAGSGQGWIVGNGGLTLRWESNRWNQYLSNVAQDLRGVFADASGEAWAVGNNGTLLRFQGGSWSNQLTGVRTELRDVWAASESDVWAVGAAGSLLHGVSGSWTPVAGTSLDCDAVTGQNSSNVWAACQNTLLKWNGATWGVEYTAPVGTVLSSLWAGGSDVFAVASNGTTYRRRSGSWAPLSSPTANALYSVSGNGSSDVWAAGFNSTVLHGDGNTWTLVPTTGLPTTLLYSILALSATDVWVVGTSGLIGHYDGSSWTLVSSPTTSLLRHIHGTAGNDLWAVGASGTVLHWDGSAWSALTVGVEGNLRAVWPIQGHTWLVGEFGAILHRKQ